MLRILLNQSNDYKAGSVVSGSVHLTTEQSDGELLEVGEIAIAFTGQATASMHLNSNILRRPEEQGSGTSVQLFAF